MVSTVFNELSFCEKDDDDAFSNPYVVISFVFAMIGKFGISGSFAVMYNYTAELFPTPVRANAVGFCSMISRIGGILTPVILALYDKVSWLPGLIFGGFAVIAGVLAFALQIVSKIMTKSIFWK